MSRKTATHICICAVIILVAFLIFMIVWHFVKPAGEVRLALIKTVDLPDVVNGVENAGFTSTGLAYDAGENCFWAGNYGKIHPSDTVINNSIVKLSIDGKQNLYEINLATILPDHDIQGVALDEANDTLWFASVGANKIYNIKKDGTLLSTLSYDRPNGLSYDNRTDTLWILSIGESDGTITNVDKTGNIINTYSYSNINNGDMLHLDSKENSLYFTAGANYSGENYIYKMDLNNGSVTLYATLKESYAVEGLYIDDDIIYILNDGLFHNCKLKKNVLNIYKINK